MKKGRVRAIGILVIVLIFALPKTLNYFFRYNKAEGVVVKLKTGIFGGLHSAAAFQYPVVEFTVGHSNLFYHKDNEVLFSMPSVGQPVTVLYNPADFEDAYLNKFGSFWFALPDLLIFGILLIAWIGIVNIAFVKPRRSRSKEQNKA